MKEQTQIRKLCTQALKTHSRFISSFQHRKWLCYSTLPKSTPELLEEIAFENHYRQHLPLKLDSTQKIYERQSFLESPYITKKRELSGWSDYLAKGVVKLIKSMIELYFGKSK